MQVNSIAPITVIYKDNFKFPLKIYSKVNIAEIKYATKYITGYKPIKFIWEDSHLRPITPKLIRWLQEEFKPLFDYDPLLWLASVGTCCPEIRPYLKDFHERDVNKYSHI